jgi:hypothetical protein
LDGLGDVRVRRTAAEREAGRHRERRGRLPQDGRWRRRLQLLGLRPKGACGIRRIMADVCCCCCCCAGGRRGDINEAEFGEGDEGGGATDNGDDIFFLTGGPVSTTACFKSGGACEPPSGHRVPTTPLPNRARLRNGRQVDARAKRRCLLERSTISISPASAFPAPATPPGRGPSKNAEVLPVHARRCGETQAPLRCVRRATWAVW